MKFWILFLLIGMAGVSESQIPVEVFVGDDKATLDILFFRYFKTQSGQNSKFLFFNRNRASMGYQMSQETHRPQFGFTEAISFNHPRLRGFAPVVVGQVFSSGVYSKGGIQYVLIGTKFTVFSWIVSEIRRSPSLDHFVLFRFTPKLTKTISLFTQVEGVSTFPTNNLEPIRLTQRIRGGLKFRDWQMGLGADVSEAGRRTFLSTSNLGLFLRHEF